MTSLRTCMVMGLMLLVLGGTMRGWGQETTAPSTQDTFETMQPMGGGVPLAASAPSPVNPSVEARPVDAPQATIYLIPNYPAATNTVVPPPPATPARRRLIAWHWNLVDSSGRRTSRDIPCTTPYGRTPENPDGHQPALEAEGFRIINSNPVFSEP